MRGDSGPAKGGSQRGGETGGRLDDSEGGHGRGLLTDQMGAMKERKPWRSGQSP